MRSVMHMLERAQIFDAEEISKLHSIAIENVCSSHYPPEIIEIWNKGRELSGLVSLISSDNFFVVRSNKVIEGFVHFRGNEIIGLFLRLDSIGKGLGRKLFEFAVSEIDQRPVKLLASLNAVEFYKHMGCQANGYIVERRNDRDIYFAEMTYA